MRNHENLKAEINQLMQTEIIGGSKTRPKPEYDKLWFPTPETCSDPENLSSLEREIYEQISHFKSLEKVDPKIDPSQTQKFLEKFNWENCFSSFIRHYLDPCQAANICTQYMDHIGSAVKNFDELIPNLRKIFECIRKSGLKLSPNKCEIGTQKIKILGKYITPAGVSTENSKIEKFLKNFKMPQTVKQVKRLVGFLQFWISFQTLLKN